MTLCFLPQSWHKDEGGLHLIRRLPSLPPATMRVGRSGSGQNYLDELETASEGLVGRASPLGGSVSRSARYHTKSAICDMTLKHSIILHIKAHCFEPKIILISSSLKIRHVRHHRSYNTSMLNTLYGCFFDSIQAPSKNGGKRFLGSRCRRAIYGIKTVLVECSICMLARKVSA